MIKSTLAVSMILIVASNLCHGQAGGGISYSQSGVKARAEQRDQARRRLAESDRPPTGTSTFVEADVLMNVKADEYVAVFGISQDGETVADCSKKMDAVAKEFTDGIKALGIGDDHLYLDFVAQTKVYGYEIQGNIAKEQLVGFELKKNLSVRYTDRDMLDKLLVVAARSKVFDLIKVDYIVKDLEPIQDRLMEEASRVIKRKSARYEKLLGIKLQAPAQVYSEKTGAYYPSGMYDSYNSAEAEHLYGIDNNRYTVQSARRSRTFVFNALDSDGFDTVINPVIIEPVVQFTLHLKLKYEVEQIKAK